MQLSTHPHEPEQDDLERANCLAAGAPGHRSCGVCSMCGKPRFVCGGWVLGCTEGTPPSH